MENKKLFKAEKINQINKKEGEMVNIKDIVNFFMVLSLILIIIAGITFFYKNILITIILLFVGGIIYIFARDIAKIIKGVMG